MKINKKLLLITTAVILLPILFGAVYWEQLPETMATHWGIENEPNGWSSKPFAVFGIPGVMAALHVFCLFITYNDPKKQNIGKKAISVVYWIMPCVSLAVMSMTYAHALGNEVDIGMICMLILGILLIVLGNYLPKARQNYTFGYKIPWTLSSEENWNRTHRLAGWIMVAVGFFCIINAFFFIGWVFLAAMAAAAIVPIAYSFILYKKGV